MQQQLKSIVDNLIECFDGKPWYGTSLMGKLKSVAWERVNEKVYGDKSMAVLVRHILNWRTFVLKKLQGDAGYTIVMDSETDWTATFIKNREEWEALLQELTNNQVEILAILNASNDELLSKQVPGKDYTFKPILTSIAQHDIYHLGQIAMLDSEKGG